MRRTKTIVITLLEREHERETRTRNTNMITRNNAKVEVFPHNKKKIHVVRRHRLLDRIFGAAFGTMKIKKSEQYYVGSGMS